MLGRSGWARWRRAKHADAKALIGHTRRAISGRFVRRRNAASDADRARIVSERRQFAERIDGELRVLCRAEAAARRELGSAAHVLLRQHAYRRLGFVRLSDYARERLGLSARTLQTAAWVATRLDALPAVSAAFDRTEISWTQARLICAVASTADEERWLAVTRGSTVEALADLVKRAQPPPDVVLDPGAETNEIDGEPAVRWRLACPARVRALWRHALELASRLTGGPLADWCAAEIIAAEGSSGRPPGASMGERALLVALRLGRGAHPAIKSRPTDDAVSPNAVATVASDTLLRPGDSLATITPTDAFTLDARLSAARRAIQTSDARIGQLLRVIVGGRFHRLFGFVAIDAYVRERLGISARKAWALLKLEKATGRSDEFARAYGEGALSWARALTLLPVLERKNAAAWITRAQMVTVRRLCDEVNHVLEARDALGPDATFDPPPADSTLASPVPAVVKAECRKLSLASGLQIRAHAVLEIDAAARRARAEVCDAAVSFTGPASVVALLRDVMDAFALPDAPRWVAFERLLLHVIAHWQRSPRHPDPIFARDGWRCTVPACSSRRNLHDHHVIYRGRGGGNEQTNRVAVCAAHHLHGIHPGVIRASGLAPDDVHWELGIRWGAPPLATYVGDRVCAPESTEARSLTAEDDDGGASPTGRLSPPRRGDRRDATETSLLQIRPAFFNGSSNSVSSSQ